MTRWTCLVAMGLVACTGGGGTNDAGMSDAGEDISYRDGGACTSLQPWNPQAGADPGAGGVWVTISGEANGLIGYPFPPQNPTADTFMPDGWTFEIFEYIVVVDHVTLWAQPNEVPTDQSQHGAQVAHLDGPFVVDLHKGGKILGQGGPPEEATPIGSLTSQNDNGGAAFDPTQYYAFGFSTVPATCNAINVNLTPDELADYDLMVANHYSVLYVGVATWNGSASSFGCTQTNASDGGYDFSKLPQQMSFKLGFSTPTDYVNCQNESLGGPGVGGEDFRRGIQVSPSQSVFAQVTMHMDHPLWESFAEGSPVHWDQVAAQYIGVTNPVARTEDMVGVPFFAFTDSTHTPLPWRNCVGPSYTPPGNGQMSFSTLSVPINPNGTCTMDACPAIRDYYDYMRFTQSTQGHLNSQGLCFIHRRYPAPAGGS